MLVMLQVGILVQKTKVLTSRIDNGICTKHRTANKYQMDLDFHLKKHRNNHHC